MRLLQVHLPPIAHCIMYAVDVLAMREQAKGAGGRGQRDDPGVSSALTSTLTGAITKMVNKSNPCAPDLSALLLTAASPTLC
jgi:hypothetical protein